MSIDPDPSQATERGAIPADSYANRLMLARAHADHISIRDAADLCGLGRGAWTNWEKGSSPGDKVESAKVISEKLGVDYHWLLFGGELPREEPRRRGRGRLHPGGSNERLPRPARTASPRSTERPRDKRPPSGVSADRRRPNRLRAA